MDFTARQQTPRPTYHTPLADTKADLPYAAQHTAPLLMLWTCAVFYCETDEYFCAFGTCSGLGGER